MVDKEVDKLIFELSGENSIEKALSYFNDIKDEEYLSKDKRLFNEINKSQLAVLFKLRSKLKFQGVELLPEDRQETAKEIIDELQRESNEYKDEIDSDFSERQKQESMMIYHNLNIIIKKLKSKFLKKQEVGN